MRLSLGVVITNYQTWELTHRCLEACLCLDRDHIDDILVYDDCSPSENPLEFPSRVRFVRAPRNSGLASALNTAVQLMTTDIVVVFDSDACPITPFANKTRERFANQPDLGQLGYATCTESMRRTASHANEPSFWSILLGQALYARVQRNFDEQNRRVVIYTCAMALRRDSFVQLGGFDESFDWLDLDLDLSMRINRSSWKIGIAQDVQVFHVGSGAPQLTRHRVLRYYKNRWHLLRKHDLVPFPRLVKTLVLARLGSELLFLSSFGRLLYKNLTRYQDKLQGRRDVLKYCRLHY